MKKIKSPYFNKKTLYIFSVTAVITAFCVLMCNAYNKVSMETAENKTIGDYKYKVIIDAGHGGEDGGTQASDGTIEKDINLSIAQILRDMLVQGGFEVEMIREEDISVGDNSLETVRERKRSDLEKRVEIYNSDENNIVLSIHQNNFSENKYNGTQIFYSDNTESQELSEYIRQAVVGLVQPDNERQCKPADDSIFVLRNAKVPAIIIECGFLSNPQELEKLKDYEYQKEIAFAIYMGFAEYCYNN